MKQKNFFIALLLGWVLAAPDAMARGGGRDRSSGGMSRGGGSSSSFSRPSSGSSRNPTTGSSLSRPSTRPTTRPTTPSTRPAIPSTRPVEKPSVQRPSTLPSTRPSIPSTKPSQPSTRPSLPDSGSRPGQGGIVNRPGQRPGPGLGERPTTLPADRRPSIDRPTGNRPSTLPGMVTYPSRPGMGNGMRPGNLTRPSTLPANTGKWNHNQWGGDHGIWGNGNNVNINIDKHYHNSYVYSRSPRYWGARPWWGAGSYHGWHHGHWSYGWSSHYYHHHWWCDDDDDFIQGIMWGIGVWSLGNMIYNMGYHTYSNPYPAPAVQNTYVTYTQPVSVAAAANPPGDEASVASAEAKSNAALQRSREAFAKSDYMTASKSLDEAIAATPGDVTLHEYRSLIFFALGKFSDAAGVLNPVLASGPGWAWETMIGFYTNSETYNQQLRKLEDYTKATPNMADARFLLGYHYMVCGHMKEANAEFAKACELQPADSISRQLRDLTKSSLPATNLDPTPPAKPDLMTQNKLPGIWVSDRGKDGKVTFDVKPDGNYTWSYLHEGQATTMNGTYTFNDKGLVVMTAEDTQMIAELVRQDDAHMKFTIIGAPDGDPGLDFTKG